MAIVAAVSDIRTIKLKDGGELHPAGIEAFGLLKPAEAHSDTPLLERMTELLPGQRIEFVPVTEKADRYGRTEALILLSDGRTLQETLASDGLAIAMPAVDPLPCFAAILAAEAAARQARRGAWSGDLAQIPRARPDDLRSRVPGFAIFEGPVISVGVRPSRTYINFGHRWSEDVSVSIAARERIRFGGDLALEALAGKRIRVRGFLEDRFGPSLSLGSPDAIEVIGPAARDVQESP